MHLFRKFGIFINILKNGFLRCTNMAAELVHV